MLHTDLIAPIPELLRRHAAARGEKIAYRDAQTSVTYASLLERTGKLAGHLADNDIGPGDTVAIMLPNSVQWVESCFAIARAGAVGVPISYDFDRSGNQLSAQRRQLQSGDHDRRARRSVRKAASVRTQFEDADRDRSRPMRRACASL